VSRRAVGWHRAGLLLLALLVWEAAARGRWLDPDFVSPPSRIVLALADLTNPRILAAARLTATEVLVAFTLAAVIGVGGGLLIGHSGFAYRAVRPMVLFLFSMPKMVMLPLFILFFGIGLLSKAVFAFSLGVFPVLLNVITGARMVEPTLIAAATSMGASRPAIFAKVVLPASLPAVVTGLRVGMTQTVLGVLLAELYAANTGLGYYVALYSQTFKPAQLFALFFLVAAISILVNEALRVLERRASRWREEEVEAVVAP
jgi:ABC-type nitrate/sulfonate/bicarbonate transport system permease component